jgi:hypothetical protein
MSTAGRTSIRFDWDGDNALKVMRDGAYQAAVDVLTEAMTEAKARVSKKTGTLERSGAVTANKLPDMMMVFQAAGGGKHFSGTDFLNALLPKQAPRSYQVKLYGSFNTPYAAKQHESNGPGSKYLEQPMMSARQKLLKALGTNVVKSLRVANRLRFAKV